VLLHDQLCYHLFRIIFFRIFIAFSGYILVAGVFVSPLLGYGLARYWTLGIAREHFY
jgi:hypothetical protein